MKKIYLQNEFSNLKRVVLAQSEFIFPKILMSENDSEVFSKESKEAFKDKGGMSFSEAFPYEQKKWENEREELKRVLEKYDIEVLRPRLLTDSEKEQAGDFGCSNFFVRDPFFTIGDTIFEASLRYFHRRNEIFPVRELLEEETFHGENLYVSVPKPDTSKGISSEVGPFLEGGDVLVLDNVVLVGNSGQASNHKGFLWLHSYLKHLGYQIIMVPLRNDVLHLDCALSLVKNGLMIICEEAFLDGVPEPLKHWDKISLPFSEVAKLGINGLPINESTYIIDPAFQYVGEHLEAKGIKIEYVDFQVTRSLGGSFRCSTQPLLRTNK